MAEHFLLKGDATRLELKPAAMDETVVITEQGIKSDDPHLVPLLEEHPALKSVSAEEFNANAKKAKAKAGAGDAK